MPGQTFTLAEFPPPYIELACDKCGRQGGLRKAHLIAQYGADIKLPDLLIRISECELAGNMHDPCGMYYVALEPQ